MMLPVSPILGGAVVTNARGRPPTPVVPMHRVGRAPPPAVVLKPAVTMTQRLVWAAPMIAERSPEHIQAEADQRARSVDRIVALVAKAFLSSPGALCAESRTVDIVKARQSAMWIARRFTGRSLTAIGRRLGGRDHTTVLHGCRKVDGVVTTLGQPDEDTPEAWVEFLRRADWPGRKGDRKSPAAA